MDIIDLDNLSVGVSNEWTTPGSINDPIAATARDAIRSPSDPRHFHCLHKGSIPQVLCPAT